MDGLQRNELAMIDADLRAMRDAQMDAARPSRQGR